MQFLSWLWDRISEEIDNRSGKNDIYLANGIVVEPFRVERLLERTAVAEEICIVARTIREGRLFGTQEACAVVVPSQRVAERFKNDIPGLAAAIVMEFETALRDVASFQRPSRTFIHPDPLPRTPSGRILRAEVAEWVDKQSVLTG